MTQPQFLYQLKLIPRLLDESNWTEEENRIVEKHFRHLKNLVKNGVVLHAGRTSLMDEDGFGIVIFQADSEEDAHEIMNSDPAVISGGMTARLFPYHIALWNEGFPS